MRKFTPFFLSALLCAAIVTPKLYRPAPMNPAPKTIYDTAVAMLRDFVRLGHDMRLGLDSSAAALDGAWIDLTAGIPLYFVREDTLLSSQFELDSQLIDLGRKVYPVYTQIGSIQKLCSSITFDSSARGWRPVVFEDSNLIAPFLIDRAKSSEPASYAMIEMPFINDKVIVKRDTKGEHIVPTKELRTQLGADFPPPTSQTALPFDPVDGHLFLQGLVRHMKAIEQRPPGH